MALFCSMVYTKEEAKIEIKKIIDNFKANYQIHKRELEANTETKLVEPLFEILGWTKKDFVKQEKAHRGTKTGHADYAFYIGDRIVFFLEVKKIGVHLEKEADKQVISYALSKRIPFAVSTNFEQLKIFCVEEEKAIDKKFRIFNEPDDYINRFHDLWLLSRDSFEQNTILKLAEDEDGLKRRVSIDKTLLDDLMHIRKLISFDLEKKYPNRYEVNEKDDIIQRIIDRLIFVRRCEDIGINPDNIMLEEIRRLPDNKAYSKLKEIFSKYNDVYNAGLFAIEKDNDCDKINIDGSIIKKLAYYLYESKNKEYIYDFDWIDADVLGQVYEQYLGKILAQTKSGRAKLKNGQLHRKEQGIYYTPTYVVDYIVKNTVDELLKNKKIKANNIKVLDPACGSGSFLIKAFDYIHKNLASNEEIKQHKIDSQGAYSIKTKILKNNIFGVDLDNKAVEITKLNLLLKAAEKRRKLPEELDKHIRQGNSLINDENIAGLNAFQWKGEFQEGTFDVVIGNPPYIMVENLEISERKYMMSHFQTAIKRFDIYIGFIEKAINLLKTGGLVGFIIPYQFLTQDYAEKLREYILKNATIRQIVDLSEQKVFQEAAIRNIILVVEKGKRKIKTKIVRSTKPNSYEEFFIEQNIFEKVPDKKFRTNIDETNIKVLDKITSNSIMLGKIAVASWGARGVPKSKFHLDKPINNFCKKMIKGINVKRYSTNYSGKWFLYEPKKLYRPSFPELFENEKLVFRGVVDKKGMVVTYDNKKYYTDHSLNCLILKYNLEEKDKSFFGKRKIDMGTKDIELSRNFDLKFILGIINSKVIGFYFKQYFSDELHVYPEMIEQLPIPNVSQTQQQVLIKFVEKILSLNEQLNKIGDKKTIQSKKIEDEIDKTNKEIDEIVYKIYGITNQEKEIIEKSLSQTSFN